MFETASAQPIGLFQSPSLAAVERLLSSLSSRLSGLDRFLLSRQETFVERVFSRHFDAIGLPERRHTAVTREVPPAVWKAAASWVPAPREQRSALPAERGGGSVTAAPARAAKPAPQPLRPTATPAPSLPVLSPDSAAPVAAARAVAMPGPATGSSGPAAAPSRAPIAPAAAEWPMSADAARSPAAPPPPSLTPTVVDSPEAATPRPEAVVTLPALAPSVTERLERAEQSSSAAAAPAAPPASLTSTEASSPDPSDARVRDLLAWAVAPAGTSSQAVAGTPAQPRAKSFQHLSWADTQLSRSPWWRAAALPSLAGTPPATIATPPLSAPLAMPVLQTPELVAPARARTETAPPGRPGVAVGAAMPGSLAAVGPATPALAQPGTSLAAATAANTSATVEPMAAVAPQSQATPTLRAVSGQAETVVMAGVSPSPVTLASAQPLAPEQPASAELDTPPAASSPAMVRLSPAVVRRDTQSPAALTTSEASFAPPPAPLMPRRSSSFQLAAPRPAESALGVDPGLLPQYATADLEQLLAASGAPAAHQASASWAQPGGLLSLPAWSPTGIMARLADGPLSTQLAGWSLAPGVASSLRRSVAEALPPRQLSVSAASLARPWVAPEVASAAASTHQTERSVAPAGARTAAVRTPESARLLPPSPLTAATLTSTPAAAATVTSAAGPVLGLASPSVAALPQPWREVGGMAALAELFAAGVGLGSAVTASYAQPDSGMAQPSLVADWLQPLLRSGAMETAPYVSGLATRPALAPLPATTARRAVSDNVVPAPVAASAAAGAAPRLTRSPLPFLPAPVAALRSAERPSATPLAALGPAAPRPSAPSEPSAPASRLSPAMALPAITESASTADFATLPSLAGMGSLFPALPLGGLGWLAQRFAGAQGLRALSSGLPFVAETATWASAPGLPDSLQRELRQVPVPVPTKSSAAAAPIGLPYLSLLPPRSPSAAPTAVVQPAAVASQPAAGLTRPAMQSASTPLDASAHPSLATAAPASAPWFAPGGGGTLAELFATGIATTSGAAAWLGQLHEQAPRTVVPPWVRSWLAAQHVDSAQATATSLRPAGGVAIPRPYLTPEQAPLSDAAARTAPALRPLSPAQPEQSARAATGERSSLPMVGMASVRAEQFATQQGLVAGQASLGQWAPVTGGLVWLPTPSATASRPLPAAPPALPVTSAAATGGLGLRSELFVRQEQARVLGPGQGLISSLGLSATAEQPVLAATTPTSSVGRWTRGGGLLYLPTGEPAPRSAAQQPAAARVHVSPMELTRPWATLPAELGRLGLGSFPGLKSAPLVGVAQATAPSATDQGRPVSPRPVLAPSERASAPRAFAALPVLAGDSLRSDSEVRLSRPTPAPAVVRSQRPYELAARFASSMLTAFPPVQAARPAEQQPEAAKPQLLWPQTSAVSQERIQRVLAMLPAELPSVGPLAALAELNRPATPSAGTGMPLWQRLPATLPVPAPSVEGEGADVPGSEDAMERRAAQAPDLTLIQGDSPARQRRSSAATARPSTVKPASPPPVEVFKAALAASGASREHVEASAKLMQVIQGQAAGSAARGDDRLSLDDLTLVAISMGQGRMAAASVSGTPNIPSVEAALGMPPATHPSVNQDDREVRRKLDRMAEHVAKQVKQLKENQGVRGGFSM